MGLKKDDICQHWNIRFWQSSRVKVQINSIQNMNYQSILIELELLSLQLNLMPFTLHNPGQNCSQFRSGCTTRKVFPLAFARKAQTMKLS